MVVIQLKVGQLRPFQIAQNQTGAVPAGIGIQLIQRRGGQPRARIRPIAVGRGDVFPCADIRLVVRFRDVEQEGTFQRVKAHHLVHAVHHIGAHAAVAVDDGAIDDRMEHIARNIEGERIGFHLVDRLVGIVNGQAIGTGRAAHSDEGGQRRVHAVHIRQQNGAVFVAQIGILPVTAQSDKRRESQRTGHTIGTNRQKHGAAAAFGAIGDRLTKRGSAVLLAGGIRHIRRFGRDDVRNHRIGRGIFGFDKSCLHSDNLLPFYRRCRKMELLPPYYSQLTPQVNHYLGKGKKPELCPIFPLEKGEFGGFL